MTTRNERRGQVATELHELRARVADLEAEQRALIDGTPWPPPAIEQLHLGFTLPTPIDDVELAPTISALRGESLMRQCGWCGVALCVSDGTDLKATDDLGPCPRCGHATWWRQEGGITCFVLATDGDTGKTIVDRWLAEQRWTLDMAAAS